MPCCRCTTRAGPGSTVSWSGRFLGKKHRKKHSGRIPYRWPWIGFWHNPPGIPRWHNFHDSPQALLAKGVFQESLRRCLGLVVLSEDFRAWLQPRVGVPVVALKHPSEIPPLAFTMDRFRNNPHPRLLQVGWWLRRLHSIYQVPVVRLHRSLLRPDFPLFARVLQRERKVLGLSCLDEARVEILPFAPPQEYDQLLAENVVFCHLFATSANNVVIECIARNTPIVINPLPAIVEYLGADYPLYFDSLEEAASKAEDLQLVESAHQYLTRLPKEWLSALYFRASLQTSSIYRDLPNPEEIGSPTSRQE